MNKVKLTVISVFLGVTSLFSMANDHIVISTDKVICGVKQTQKMGVLLNYPPGLKAVLKVKIH